MDEALRKKQDTDVKSKLKNAVVDKPEIDNKLKRVFVIYEQAFKKIKDINFIIDLLSIANEYDNSETLQNKIVR